MRIMNEDPNVNKEILQKHYGKNYTDMLKLNRLSLIGRKDSDDSSDGDQY